MGRESGRDPWLARLVADLTPLLKTYLRASVWKIGVAIMGVGAFILSAGELFLRFILNAISAVSGLPPPAPPSGENVSAIIAGSAVLVVGMAVTFYGIWLVERDRRRARIEEGELARARKDYRINFTTKTSWFSWIDKGDTADELLSFRIAFRFTIDAGDEAVRLVSVRAWRLVMGCWCHSREPWLETHVPESDYKTPPKGARVSEGAISIPVPQDFEGDLVAVQRIDAQRSAAFSHGCNLWSPNDDFSFSDCNAGEIKVEIRIRRQDESEARIETFCFREETLGVERVDGLRQPPQMNDAQLEVAHRRRLLGEGDLDRLERIGPQDRYLHIRDTTGRRANRDRLRLADERTFVRSCWDRIEGDAEVRSVDRPLYAPELA